jgi:2,3-bisphosphoglycerate-independent phosphoglycerate mutase
MGLATTASLDQDAWNTLPVFEGENSGRNQRLNKVICAPLFEKRDTSSSIQLEEEDIGICHERSKRFSPSQRIVVDAGIEKFLQHVKDVIFSYVYETRNSLLIKEYSNTEQVSTFHSLFAVGEELFGNARPRNEAEAEFINNFIRSKTRVIASKKLC